MAKKRRRIFVGPVAVGGGAPLAVQTMAKVPPNELHTIASLRLANGRGRGPSAKRLLFEGGQPRAKHSNRLLGEALMERLKEKMSEAVHDR